MCNNGNTNDFNYLTCVTQHFVTHNICVTL